MDEGAIPSNFSTIMPTEEVAEVKELNGHDQALAKLHRNEDWLAFEELVKKELIELRQLKGIGVQGVTNEEIGQQFRVANLAADMIEKFLLRVKEAHEEVKANEKAKRNNN